MVAESNAEAEKCSTDDEHCDVLSGCVEDGSHEETDGSADDASPSAFVSGYVGSGEGGNECGDVERGGEESEDLIVVFAVICFLEMLLLSSVDPWEEFLEEIIHGGHSPCRTK